MWVAAFLAYALLSRFTQHLLSLAAGALLATAFMRLLPEAFEQSAAAGLSAQVLFAVLLMGLVFFFLLDKAELWHHGHEHGHAHDLKAIAIQRIPMTLPTTTPLIRLTPWAAVGLYFWAIASTHLAMAY